MLAGLKGTIEAIGANWVVVEVGGISFQVFLPTSTLSSIGTVGQKVKLHTHLAVREDNLSLYGFGSARELALFQTLITVSGIGPKLGMAMLSAMDTEQLTLAIARGEIDMLTSIPGIGKKTASRIILELKDKIATGWMVTLETAGVQGNSEVMAALISLGYSTSEASRALGILPRDQNLSLEEKITLALKYFGGKE